VTCPRSAPHRWARSGSARSRFQRCYPNRLAPTATEASEQPFPILVRATPWTRPTPALDLDPLRHLAEAALARQKAHNASRPTCRPPVDSQGRGADHTLTLAEAQQLAEHLTGATVRHRAGHLPSHLRHTFATWLQHGGPRPGHRRADGARRRPPHRLGRGGEGSVIGRHYRHTTSRCGPGSTRQKQEPYEGSRGAPTQPSPYCSACPDARL
jgi:hypothetical protein